MRRGRGLLCLLVVLLGACGVPVDDQARAFDAEDVPFGLLDEADRRAATTTTAPAPATVDVYFVAGERSQLVGVARPAPGDRLEDLVATLLAGPTEDEVDRGLSNALPDPAVVRSVELTSGVATVDLDESFTMLDSLGQQRLALAQLVFTLTGRPGVGRVAFTIDGRSVRIPRGDSTLTSGSVSRDSYQELAPSG